MSLSYNISTTKALVIGTSKYKDRDFADIPPVENNIKELKRILSDNKIVGLPTKNIEILLNKEHGDILEAIQTSTSDVNTDTIIIYYAGHGHRTSARKLFLTSINTKKEIPEASGIDFDLVERFLQQSPIKKKIVILDCCYSGIATMDGSLLSYDQGNIMGSYILASSSARLQSLYDAKERFTFFSKELFEAFRVGADNGRDVLSTNDIFRSISTKLKNANRPTPWKKNNLNIDDFFISKNIMYQPEFLMQKADAEFKDKNFKIAHDLYIICNYLALSTINEFS